MGLSQGPDLDRVELIVLGLGFLILGCVAGANAAMSDGPDPTDNKAYQQLAQRNLRVARGEVGVIVLPPVQTLDGKETFAIAVPMPESAPLGVCDDEGDCDNACGQACKDAGFGGGKDLGSTKNLTQGQSCSCECSGGCNVNGCPQAVFDCASPTAL